MLVELAVPNTDKVVAGRLATSVVVSDALVDACVRDWLESRGIAISESYPTSALDVYRDHFRKRLTAAVKVRGTDA